MDKKIKFPDGYAAGLKRAVNLKTGKLIGLKSHDFHILMERIIPVIRDENGRERSGKYLYRFHFHIYLAGRKQKRNISVTKTNGINTGIEKRYDPVGLKPKSDGNRYFCSVNQHHETIYSKLNNK
jgi:hypothetical protein